MSVPLGYYLMFGGVLFTIGLCGALTRKNAIAVLISIEIMFNAAILNFVVFWYYLHNGALTGQMFALFAIAVAAAESAVGLALVIAVYRHYRSVNVTKMDALKG
jgi:NADH-quinone oxidoreductase subunit K